MSYTRKALIVSVTKIGALSDSALRIKRSHADAVFVLINLARHCFNITSRLNEAFVDD